MRGSGVIL